MLNRTPPSESGLPPLLERLWRHAGGRCRYCHCKTTLPVRGRAGIRAKPDDQTASKDHLIPRSRFGYNRRENLALACQACNRRKGNRTPQEFYAEDHEWLVARIAERAIAERTPAFPREGRRS